MFLIKDSKSPSNRFVTSAKNPILPGMETQGRTFLLNAYGDHADDRISSQRTRYFPQNLDVNPKSVQSSEFAYLV